MRLVQKQDAINWDSFMPNSSRIDWEWSVFLKKSIWRLLDLERI